VTVLPVLNLTRAVFRSPEFGFFGLVMPTLRHTPLRDGARTSRRAGETGLRRGWGWRGWRRVWESVVRRLGVVEKGWVWERESKVAVVVSGGSGRWGDGNVVNRRGRRREGVRSWRRVETAITSEIVLVDKLEFREFLFLTLH